MKPLQIFLILFLISVTPAMSQFYPAEYRPPIRWQQLQTDHFKVVFPAGEDSAAWKTAAILEQHYGRVQELTGGELNQFPFILKNYSDRSNGFVTSLHFRSELDLAPMAGKALNPRGGGWLETVAPHELVHALQYSNLGNVTIPRILSLFSPDMGRSFHGAIPSGINEGLAVYHESGTGAGRANYPFFTNRFESTFNSPLRWSMGQMVQRPIYTRPFNRYYIGGAVFTGWLHSEFGEGVSRDALDFYVRFPFLGYGTALRHVTGSWPSQLYRRMAEDRRGEGGDPSATAADRVLPELIPEGASVRSPAWLNDSTLVFYGSFYNRRPGFYRYSLGDGQLNRFITTTSVSDYHYTLSPDGLVYAYYRPDVRYDNTWTADLRRYDFAGETDRGLSSGKRLYSPSWSDGEILALQTRGNSNRLVRYDAAADSVHPVLEVPGVRLAEVAVHPRAAGPLGITAHNGALQGLWLTGPESAGARLSEAPDISFEGGSVFDPAWHPEGGKLLFSADFSGIHQIYEYDLALGTVRQVTDSRFNAFEGAYDPTGDRIAYIIQEENRMVPALLRRDHFAGRAVSRELWQGGPADEIADSRTGIPADTTGWERSSYSSGINWIRPRLFTPVFNEISNRNIHEIGLSFHSNDLLQSQSYRFDITGLQDRHWYDLSYRNARFFPGYEFSLSSRPSFRDFELEDAAGEPVVQTFLRQQRSVSLSVPIPLVLQNNVWFSSLFIRPTLERAQIRYFELHHIGNPASGFGSVTSGGLFASLAWRLQQNIRDVQPNSGLVVFSQLEHYLDARPLNLNTSEGVHRLSFIRPTAFRGGIHTYLSPFRRLNQSLRISMEGITQTSPIWDNQIVVSPAFADAVFPLARNLVSISTRYTIPLVYPDEGGLLLPLYLGNIYLSLFSDTVIDPSVDRFRRSRSVFGLAIRSRMRLSNLSLDLGIGVGFEPARNRWDLLFGQF